MAYLPLTPSGTRCHTQSPRLNLAPEFMSITSRITDDSMSLELEMIAAGFVPSLSTID
jgi:hypothetical protein